MKKFELVTEISKEFFGKKLFRIKALISFGDVEKDEIGGWIEKESNLDQVGNAWVFGNAQVSGDARVYGDEYWITIGPIGSENGFLTAFRQADNSIVVRRGCFSGTIEEFESAANERHGNTIDGDIYRALIPVIKMRLKEIEVTG